MRDITAKTDNTGDTLTADAFNANLRTELQSLVTDTGQTLDPEAGPDTDQDMIGKALAQYSSDGGFYQDAGAADAYVLGRVGNLQPVPAYFDGQQIVFVAGNTNTGASTVNVTTLGAKDFRRIGGAVLSAGDIPAGSYIVGRLDFANDYFELVGFVAPASETVSGILKLTTLALQQAAADLTVAVTPGLQDQHPTHAKAKIVFDGAGGVAVLGTPYNMSAVRTGVGLYSLTFGIALADGNYAVSGSLNAPSHFAVSATTINGFSLQVRSESNINADDARISLTVT